MTTDELIDGLIAREGGFVNSAADRGGATNFGITASTLGAWRSLNRPATVAEVKALTVDEARAIYRAQYVRPFELVPFPGLQAQLCDFGANSGVTTAIKSLQGVLGVPADGVLGDRTRAAMAVLPWRLVNGALVAARVRLLEQIVDEDVSQLPNLHGWVRRAVSFLM